MTTRTGNVEALALFKADPQRFDLIITDMNMPSMAGDVLSAKLMKIRPEIPNIVCTGYSVKISEENAKEIGIKTFAYKPIIRRDLPKSIRKVLDEDSR